jgi:hypothetical protein
MLMVFAQAVIFMDEKVDPLLFYKKMGGYS